MKKDFKPKRGALIYWLLLLFILIPVGIFLMDTETFSTKPFLFLPLMVPLKLFLWAFFGTKYQVSTDTFYFQSAFIKGRVPVNKIRKIEINKTLWVGTKPALAKNGIIIYYNTFDEVYVAPEKNEELVSALTTINPDIEVL